MPYTFVDCPEALRAELDTLPVGLYALPDQKEAVSVSDIASGEVFHGCVARLYARVCEPTDEIAKVKDGCESHEVRADGRVVITSWVVSPKTIVDYYGDAARRAHPELFADGQPA